MARPAFRIFGDAQGTYGAGVAALLESKNWETLDDIADVYVRWGGHAYGGKTKGKFMLACSANARRDAGSDAARVRAQR